MSRISFRIVIISSIVFAGILVTTNAAYAAGSAFVPLAETQGGPLGDLYSKSGDLSTFINSLFKFAIIIGAIAAVLRIAYAGYLYMGQSDMWSHKGEAKAILGDVTLGLLLLLSIWIILNQINPDILSLKINIEALPRTTDNEAAPYRSRVVPDDGIQRTPLTEGEVALFNNEYQIPATSWCFRLAANNFECTSSEASCRGNASSAETDATGKLACKRY